MNPLATKVREPQRPGALRATRQSQAPARSPGRRNEVDRGIDDVVLVVDDDSDFLGAATIALKRVAPRFLVQSLQTGGQAIAYLDRAAPYEAAPRPVFIVLDFKLPDMTGRDVLEFLRGQDALRSIPVLVLTQAVWHDERERALAAGAAEFVVKPSGIQGLRDVLADFRRRHVHAGEDPTC